MEALGDAVSDDELLSVVSRVSLGSSVVGKVVPLVASEDGPKLQLVGLLVVGECEQSTTLTELEVAKLVSELAERNDDTEVL